MLSKIRNTGISELRKFLHRSPFGRPTLVWVPVAVGVALRVPLGVSAAVATMGQRVWRSQQIGKG